MTRRRRQQQLLSTQRYHPSSMPLLLSQNGSNNESSSSSDSSSSSSSSSSNDEEMSCFGDSSVMIPDLDWRVQKLRLEEENKKRFLRAGPRFLPYEEAMKWVQAWGKRWESQEDWQDWIMMGEKRNSYIPSRPDEYYTRTGDWISWEHFLGLQ
ncbi:unnamed protein product [Cylindrotheca closterium]|uniref:Uncharacterized protein n=1 Tax=Cylindrotheca closterium TaxID=2856 RepID=A0AAD2G9X3_9STRA|nr:unnamed protein product [Cylindrotheca closterium]